MPMKILEFALSSLLRRKYRNGFLIAVYAFTVFMLASVLFLTSALKDESRHLLAGLPGLVVQRTMAGRHELIPAGWADFIRRLPGVGEVRPRWWGYYYDSLTGANYTVLGTGTSLTGVSWLAGRLPAGPGECALGAGVAGIRKAGLTDDLILVDSRNVGRPFTVTGIFQSGSSLLTHDLIILTADDVIRFFRFPPEKATDLTVEVFNESETATVAAKIKQKFPDSRPISRQEIIRTYDAVFDWRGGMMLAILSAALAAFGLLAFEKASGLSAGEKRELGILKAIGWSAGHILTLKSLEGLVISLLAFLTGATAAYLHVFHGGSFLLARVLKGWSVLFPGFELVPRLDPGQLLSLAFLTVVPYIACTTLPAWRAAIGSPDLDIRG